VPHYLFFYGGFNSIFSIPRQFNIIDVGKIAIYVSILFGCPKDYYYEEILLQREISLK